MSIRIHTLFLGVILCAGLAIASTAAWAVRTEREKALAKYAEIPGAGSVGSEVCAGCHDETSKSFQHAYHKQQGVECEECHGKGSLHVDGGGDVGKIISFKKRTAQVANGICLSCHTRNDKVRHWQAGSHAANHLRCLDCHQIHDRALTDANQARMNFDTATQAAFMARSVSPETNVVLRPRSETNDACLKCHRTEGAQLSLPYHHPLREGKMSCVDCHDPHGGPAGNNLKTANVNQLCLSCHAQYRGPFAYQHPPVSENCLNCHTSHGSPNTNLLSVSEPALCLQCHAGHHNGASLPLPDRCTNCHGSIHGTDVATPSGGSRFVDKGPYGVPPRPAAVHGPAARSLQSVNSSMVTLAPSHVPQYALPAVAGAMGVMSSGYLPPLAGSNMGGNGGGSSAAEAIGATSVYSLTPGSYRFVDGSGFLGRVGEYGSLQQSLGADAVTAYVSPQNHVTLVSRADLISGDDYSAKSQLTISDWLKAGFDMRSFMQQQDNYPFYAGAMSPDLLPITDLVPSHVPFAVVRRLGSAYARLKVPKVPVHLFVNTDWQARSGATQFAYLDENVTPNCGELCHYTSQVQRTNYTTRNVGGGADIDLGPVRVTYEHRYSSFADRLVFPTGAFGPFTPADEPPPPPVPVPPAVAPGNYPLDIPAPSQASSDMLNLTWTASAKLSFNGHVGYTRMRDILTGNPQNTFESDETVNWRPLDHLRVTGDYHQQNLINDFVPFYDLFANVSYHRHTAGLRLDYELPKGFNVEGYYRRSGITRSNSSLWPQAYSFDNTDLLTVVPASFSNTTGVALRYHDHAGYWSARAGYEWTGTHDPGYLIVPQSDNRVFASVWITPGKWLTFSNDVNVIVQNAFPAVPLLRADGTGLSGDFQRRNRFYTETLSATLWPVAGWNVGVGYSYQQNNLTTYMSFQNDSGVGYVVNEPAVPYKQLSQTYWADSTYLVKKRFGLDLRLTYNSARSDIRPDINPADAALLGNQSLIASGAFDPSALFPSALGNLQLGSTLVSQVIVPQWIGQTKAYYLFPHRFEGGVIFYYGSYRDELNPGLNGVLRTFNVYVGRHW